jgi:hypothetical protein
MHQVWAYESLLIQLAIYPMVDLAKISMSSKQLQWTPDGSQKMQVEYAIKIQIYITKKSIGFYIYRKLLQMQIQFMLEMSHFANNIYSTYSIRR